MPLLLAECRNFTQKLFCGQEAVHSHADVIGQSSELDIRVSLLHFVSWEVLAAAEDGRLHVSYPSEQPVLRVLCESQRLGIKSALLPFPQDQKTRSLSFQRGTLRKVRVAERIAAFLNERVNVRNSQKRF